MKYQTFEIVTRDAVKEVQGVLFTTPELPKVQFFIYKKNRGYSLSEVKSGLEVFTGSTIKEVKQKLYDYFKNYDKNNIVLCVNNAKTIAEVKLRYKRREESIQEFFKIFKFMPPLCTWTGSLDIIRLDYMLGTSKLDGISMNDYIKKHYGIRASKVIEELLTV